jgi:hypothetical protein
MGTATPKHKLRLRAEDRYKEKLANEKLEKHIHAAIDQRDGLRCRAFQTKLSKNGGLMRGVQRHHIIFRSMGGATTTRNMCVLGPLAHAKIHARRLTCRMMTNRGADGPLEFHDTNTGKRWVSLPPNTVHKLKDQD